jgi:hypothetical protein
MKPDDVCGMWAERDVNLNIRVQDGAVLLEGDRNDLKFLAQVILAHAGSEDCGYRLLPGGSGAAFFAEDSELGLFIHQLPCPNAESHA